MNLPRLFKKTKSSKVQVCDISTNGDIITVSFGQLNGKMQTKETVCSSRNLGKSNETSPEQQAILEAKSKHESKIKSGYTLEIVDEVGLKLPMKVKVFQDQKKNVVYPCVSTPKLNGVNGLYIRENDTITLYSRGGNEYPEIPHLTPLVRQVMDHLGVNELNGELYIHGYHLQDITSAVKKSNKDSPKLHFYVFDLPDLKESYQDRRNKLATIVELGTTFVIPVVGILCINEAEIEAHYNECMNLGYEGTVIKNMSGIYEYNVRSSDQFKYKKTQDAEYLVIDYELDKNKHVVYKCATKDRQFFKVKRKGTNEERLLDADNAESNVGKWLTVSFECLSKDGIPLKPVGLNFRECDENGEPNE
jgi:DNA ligase-1